MADTLAPFATVDDLEARWRTLTPDERVIAETLLGDASTRLRLMFPDLQGRIDGDPALAEGAKIVICGVVRRSMQVGVDTPPVSSQQTTAGPFSQQFSYANPTGDLYLTRQDKQLLGYGSQRAFSIDLLGES